MEMNLEWRLSSFECPCGMFQNVAELSVESG
jgi:hypothetical protein